METAIGVFASRDRAEEAVRELRQRGVPEDSVNYLTRSETEAKTIAKEFGTYVGGFMGGAAGMSAGVLAATLLLPGIGPVFALGFGAAALLGAAGAGTGRAEELWVQQRHTMVTHPFPLQPRSVPKKQHSCVKF